MRILVYGFGPYRHYRDNVSAKIVRALPRRRGLRKLIFPVRFQRGQFTRAVEKFRPDAILGLGQCSSGRLLRRETRAANTQRNSRIARSHSIVSGGAAYLRTNLDLELGGWARASKDAGDYVCNFSMYVILDFIKRRNLPVCFGFLHVPRAYDPKRATRILRRSLLDAKFKT